MTRFLTQRLAPLVTVAAVVAFAASLGRHHPDPSTASESGFFAWVIGLTLAPLLLARRSTPIVVAAGLLLGLTLCLPAAEGTRGALLLLLLVAAVAAVTWRLIQRPEQPRLVDFAALCTAWQCLLRSERLIDVQLSAGLAVWLVGLPLGAAVATWWLARRHGARTGGLLLAGVALATPGFGVVSVAVLGLVAALAGDRSDSWPARGVALAAAGAACFWLPAATPGVMVLLVALALRSHRLGKWLPWAAALAWWVVVIATSGAQLGAVGWLLLILPMVLFAPTAARPLALAAVILALSYRPEIAPAALATALALGALTLLDRTEDDQSWMLRLQSHWSILVLSLVTLASAYPWLRESLLARPLSEIVAPSIEAAGMPLVLLSASLALLGGLASQHRLPRWLGVCVLLGLVACAANRPLQRLNTDAAVLTSTRTRSVANLAAQPMRTITLDAYLNRSEAVPDGRVVAYLVARVGGERRHLVLRKGQDLGDWAARRLGTDSSARPWIHWFAGDGTLAQRYRVTWALPAAWTPVDQVKVVRSPRLPPATEVALITVQTR